MQFAVSTLPCSPCEERKTPKDKPSNSCGRIAKLALEQYLHHSQILTSEQGYQEMAISPCKTGQPSFLIPQKLVEKYHQGKGSNFSRYLT
jgi:hypothetical protein